jgi:hypothetical protein
LLPDLFNTPYLCATFGWPGTILLNNSELDFWREGKRLDASNVVEPDQEMGEVKVAMLVDVPEFVENRKRLFGRILPTVKRLQRLDNCAKVWPDSPEATRYLFPRPTGPPVSPGDAPTTGAISLAGVDGVNGEADVSPFATRSLSGYRGGRGVPVGEGKLPDEVVERGAEVVDHIPDDGSPEFDRRFPEPFTVDDYLAGLQVIQGVEFVQVAIVDKRIDLLVQEAQVHIRPTYLGPTSAEVRSVSHD